jgi:hypothetical protein
LPPDQRFEFLNLTGLNVAVRIPESYTYEQGLSLDPPQKDGRRCLDTDEMTAKGGELNDRGRWIDPVRVQAADCQRVVRPNASPGPRNFCPNFCPPELI